MFFCAFLLTKVMLVLYMLSTCLWKWQCDMYGNLLNVIVTVRIRIHFLFSASIHIITLNYFVRILSFSFYFILFLAYVVWYSIILLYNTWNSFGKIGVLYLSINAVIISCYYIRSNFCWINIFKISIIFLLIKLLYSRFLIDCVIRSLLFLGV